MDFNTKMLKPITETKYLTAENVDRYRVMIRLFYDNYEKMKYWLYQEEVYALMVGTGLFDGYTQDMCTQDLSSLHTWGNLDTIQDTRHAKSIEEFKNEKYSYQLTQTSVEIERMVIRLETLAFEGSSLEPTLLERIAMAVEEMEEISLADLERVSGWWRNFQQDFKRLNQNYMDYMHELNSVKAENMMQTEAFLLFKDRMIEYLRSFIKSLQRLIPVIEKRLSELDPSVVARVLDKVVAYELSIPRFDEELNEEALRERLKGQWDNFEAWFLRNDESDSRVSMLFDTTNDMIRRITRYAARISEQSNAGANRREEYYNLAKIFHRCQDIYEAHRLSASVFGIEKPFHLKGDFPRSTDSIHSGIFDEMPPVMMIEPRVRTYHGRSNRSAIKDRSAEKEKALQEALKAIEEEERLLQSFIKDNRLVFEELPMISEGVRNRFLKWLSDSFEKEGEDLKTEDGRSFYVEKPKKGKRCILHCEDGDFDMPAYVIVFSEPGQGFTGKGKGKKS